MHVPGQLIPPVPVTTPKPWVVTVKGGVGLVKFAVTLRAVLITTTHEPVPVQSPLQPVKVEPASAVAVNVSVSPALRTSDPQVLADEGQPTLPLIAPLPVPALASVTRAKKVADTNRAVSIVTVQVVADPVQPPPPVQPLNSAPEFGVAVRVTVAPAA